LAEQVERVGQCGLWTAAESRGGKQHGVLYMHMIEAVIKPSALDGVKSRLTEMGILGCTALECKGFGKQKGHTERYRGGRMDVGFVPKVLLKIAVRGDDLPRAVEAITAGARSGRVGDGKVFVYDLAKVVRIRTGECDNDAL
jgi:nitrogen regulatory protein P-II 2